jgi:Flp pilus assembly secretin CpaC
MLAVGQDLRMMNLFRKTIAMSVLAAAALLPREGLADEMPPQALTRQANDGTVTEQVSPVGVVLDFAKILSFAQPARTIIIGNPAIVDGTLNDENTIVLTGKALGTTNMIVLGEAGDEPTRIG